MQRGVERGVEGFFYIGFLVVDPCGVVKSKVGGFWRR